MSPGAWVLVLAVVVALGFGGFRLVTDGRFRGTHRVRQPHLPPSSVESPSSVEPVERRIGHRSSVELVERRIEPVEMTTWSHVQRAVPQAVAGERATLVQFSSAFCAPCRATRRVLGEVAGLIPGVVHVEIDAEHHLDLVRRLGVLRTPTTIVLDSTGAESSRAAGAPHRGQVIATLSTM